MKDWRIKTQEEFDFAQDEITKLKIEKMLNKDARQKYQTSMAEEGSAHVF